MSADQPALSPIDPIESVRIGDQWGRGRPRPPFETETKADEGVHGPIGNLGSDASKLVLGSETSQDRAMINLRVCRLVLGYALVGGFALAPSALAQTAPKRTDVGEVPASLLWVGNSFFYYNNSMHNHFGRLASSTTPATRVRSTAVTISGSGLDWHDMESLVRPGGLGRYSFTRDNEIRFNPPGRQYDVAIIMDCSQCPVHPELQPAFHQTVRKHAQTLSKAGIRTALFMSWAYQDKPEMTAQLADQYTRAGSDNDLIVIPAGLAFANAIAKQRGIELYDADKRHPSLAGTYLAAATVYATLYRQSPVASTYTAGLDPELAAMLRAVAWETVEEYFKR